MAISDNPKRVSPTGAVRAPALHASPKLTVIVPVYNGGKHIGSCLEGLLNSEYSDFEIIVVDDGSTDDTKLIVERYPVYCIRTPRTLGPAGARNMGIGYAQASVVVFVDADVVLPPNALGIIVNEFDRDPQLAAMFGSYDEEPMWGDFCSQYKNLMHSFVHQNSNVRATTFWAGCGAIRREIFMHVGGFDHSRYRKPSIEDIELGYRLVREGQRVQLNKQLRVKHLKRWTFRNMIQTDIFCRAIPWTKLILETRNLPRDLNLTSRARVSAGLIGLLSIGWLFLLLQLVSLLPRLVMPEILVCEMAVAFLVVGALVALNWDVYSYFARKRGWWFAARVIPLHWFYYFYSGAVFAIYGSIRILQLLVRSVFPLRRHSGTTFDGSRS